ncbi:MAG TPA: hypothetical protein PLI53_00415 [Geobacteraceae bacterium]|nr:hypothetical protein [Geobacteraceae bacterium]
MTKVLVSMPARVLSRMRALVPDRQRSRFITRLVEAELAKREAALFQAAREVEQDEALNAEMREWDGTAADGVDHEPW